MKKIILITFGYMVIYLPLELLSLVLGNNLLIGNAIAIVISVLTAAFLVEKIFFREEFKDIPENLGLKMPNGNSFGAAFIISVVLLIFYPVISMITVYQYVFAEGFLLLQLGNFLVHGIGEEVLYRGFLFRHLREAGNGFYKAVFISVIFFAAAHIPLIVEQGILVGGMAFLLSAVSAFPLSYLFEKSGNSVLPPAIVHAVIDTIIPLLAAGEAGAASTQVSIYWMLLSMVVPMLAFIILRKENFYKYKIS